MDIEKFLTESTLLLDIVQTTLETIVDRMLRKLFDNEQIQCSMSEAIISLLSKDIEGNDHRTLIYHNLSLIQS